MLAVKIQISLEGTEAFNAQNDLVFVTHTREFVAVSGTSWQFSSWNSWSYDGDNEAA